MTKQSMVDLSAKSDTPIQNLHQGVVALVAHLIEEPRADLRHHFSLVNEQYIIDGEDGLYIWTLEGSCIVNGPSHDLIVKLSGDTPVAGTVDITAQDMQSGQPLDFTVLVDRPHSKVVSVFFDQPLQQHDQFSIQVSCRWSGTFPSSRRSDYVFLGWGGYAAGGVERMTGSLVSTTPLANSRLELLADGEWIATPWQPTASTDQAGGRHSLEWDISDPAHLYIVSFDRGI